MSSTITRLRPFGPALLLAAALGFLPLAGRAQAPASQAGVPVTTVAAGRSDVPVLLRNIGAVQPFQSVLVRARVDGTLDKVFFEEGQDVKRGDRLALIDPRPYQATLDQAKAKRASDAAQLENAKRDLARYANLAKSDFASRQQLDTQAAQVAQFQATLEGDDATIASAQLNLDFTNITSPIDGRTGLRMVDAGNLIHANDATGLVMITQIRPIAVIFTLPQDNLPAIQAAMAKGKLTVEAYSSDNSTRLAQGELATIDNTIDQGTGTIKLKAVFQNAEGRLWPGQFVNARLEIGVLRNALTIPSAALQHGPDGLYTYLVRPDSTVAVQPLQIVQDDGQVVVVASGLDEGAQVVTKGQSRLENGVRVTATLTKPNS